MRPALLTSLLLAAACGGPGPLVVTPDAELPPPATKVTPPPGPFNGSVALTFESDRPATIFVSVDGKDPRTTSVGRLSGPSPFRVTLEKTTTVRYFASVGGKDEELKEGQWLRAGGPKGTIAGVVVVGEFAAGKKVGVLRNGVMKDLGKPASATELPFFFENLSTGTHRLSALSDRNGDGQLIPFIDFSSETVAVQLDLNDPFKASAENVRLYLGASATGLGTIQGVITLPNPPPLQNLQIAALSPSGITGGFDPQALLQQLQAGYRIFTDPAQSEYPYVITDLKPGPYVPVPTLFGFGAGGIALNLIANPLRPVTVLPDETATADFAFGPVALSGEVTVRAASAPQGFAYGIVAARAISFTEGVQALLMPVLFSRDQATGDLKGAYAGQALRSNANFGVRVFVNSGATANPLTDALQWVVNPLAGQPPHATVMTGSTDVVQNITVP